MTQVAHTPGPLLVAYTHEGGTKIAIDDEPGMQGERDYDLFTVTHGDPDELEANARRLVACWNACVDEDIEYLEGVVSMGTTLRKEINEALNRKEQYQGELCAMERQRDALNIQRDALLNALNACKQAMAAAIEALAINEEAAALCEQAEIIADAAINKATGVTA